MKVSRRTSRTYRLLALTTGIAVATALLAPPVASAAAKKPAAPTAHSRNSEQLNTPLPAPPIGAIKPQQPSRAKAPSSSKAAAGLSAQAATPSALAAAALPPAKTFGAAGNATTLVLYDTTGDFGWLGELYAIGAGTLASHFGQVTAQPIGSYTAGQMARFTATIYVGSTYNEPIPAAFLNDVRAGTTPVIWAGSNIWQLTSDATTTAAVQLKYGWDPSTSYYDTVDQFTSVAYNTSTLNRSALSGPLLIPHITGTVTTLASAPCTTTANASKPCDGIAQVPAGATSAPWAIQSSNLTYLGEIPLSYISESDRYLAFADLLYPALNPAAPVVRRAMVRLEDVNPGTSDPAQLRQIADYLFAQKVPFSVAVIPSYRNPLGVDNNGVAQSLDISSTGNAKVSAFNSALKYMQTKGGTLIQHGTTHQFNTALNPYNAQSGDDFEFYTAHCSTTQGGPLDPNGCPDSDWVVQTGPVPGDTQAAAATKVTTGKSMFARAGLNTPTIFETPHYSASAPDYLGFRQVYTTRYEREQFFSGQLSGAPLNYSRLFGQFFPYTVNDVYNTQVLPESLGNYEPVAVGNNPPRLAADIVNNAKAELSVRQGVASFFYHPYYETTGATSPATAPLAATSPLAAVISGIKGLGYTFVSPAAVAAG
jgi:uncharacterized protein YdaL